MNDIVAWSTDGKNKNDSQYAQFAQYPTKIWLSFLLGGPYSRKDFFSQSIDEAMYRVNNTSMWPVHLPEKLI